MEIYIKQWVSANLNVVLKFEGLELGQSEQTNRRDSSTNELDEHLLDEPEDATTRQFKKERQQRLDLWCSLQRKTVLELQGQLQSYGIPKTGIKNELIRRIILHIQMNEAFEQQWKWKMANSKRWNSDLIIQLFRFQLYMLWQKHETTQQYLEKGDPKQRDIVKIPSSLQVFFEKSSTPTSKLAFRVRLQ